MLDWEQHSVVLHRLYMKENKTLKEMMQYMESNHGFKATSAQYQKQFKKWKFQKNLKKSDWVYVARKLTQRGQRESAVYHDSVLIPSAKVKKNISRYVHPNDAYRQSSPPPSPGTIVVRSPILIPVSRPGSPFTLAHRRRLSETSIQECSNSKRQQLTILNDLTFESSESFELSKRHTWRNAFHMSHNVDLSDLPYFLLRDMFNSDGVKKGFEQLLTLDDPLCGKIMHHFWSKPSSQASNYLLSVSDSPYAPLDLEMADDWKMSFQSLLPEPKPLGNAFILDQFLVNNGPTLQQWIVRWLTRFLQDIPHKNNEEAQVLTDLLLGPPTVEAARRFLEVGVYMVSNNLQPPLGIDIFIHNLLHSISWSILHPILSVRVPSIQAFVESVFLYTIASQQVHIVKDLSSHAHIKATVVSNGSALVSAVRTSSCELVSMILDAGACPNKRSECGEQPLTVVEDVSVAKLLLQAGADIHSEGVFRTKTRKFHGPGVMAAIASRNIDLVRYLITEGADVNQLGRHAHLSVKFSAVMLAVESGMSKILELLLQSGAKPNETSVTTGNKLREMYPLQEAARRGDIEAVQLLIEHGGNVNANVKWLLHVDSALETAVSRADVMMTKLLLRNGADVNAPPNNDVQPPRGVLTIAVEMNHFELVEVILDAGADVSILSRGYYGCTARECAICSPHGSDIRDLLVSRGAQWDTQCQTDHCQTQLREAVLAADLSRVKTLLSTGLKIDMQPFEDDQHRNIYDQNDRTKSVLQDAVAAGSAIFQMVFDVIEDYDEEIDLHPLLVEAISVKAFDIGAILLNAGADVNATRSYAGERMGTPLMFAIQGNDFEAVHFLFDKGADINIVVDPFAPLSCQHYYHACTALQVSLEAANRGTCSLDIYHFLRQHGAVINAPIPRMWGLSELALAAETGKIAIVQGLLDAGADVNSLPAESRGRTALQAAAGDIDIVQLLLQSGANVNGPIARERGVTALGAAASAGHFQVALILLKAGADVNAEFEGPGSRDNPLTPLIDAARYGRLDMVHLLLKAGADLHLPKDERYVKAARVARERGQVAIATFLETWKVDEALESSIGTRMAQNGEEGFVIELD